MEIKFIDEKIEKFICSLEKTTIAKVLRTLDLLERFGNELRAPHSSHVTNGLFELRVRGIQEVRFFYVFYRREAIILHGFIKKSDRIPAGELRIARERLKQLDRL